MNIPIALTLLRIFFVPLLVAALVEQNLHVRLWGDVVLTNDIVAVIIFLAAAGTDLLDGYLARRWGQITTVGTLFDPIADKLLISAALISLVQIHLVPGWMVILIVGREFAVSGLRSIAAAEGYTIRASELGKTKMVLQVVAISMVMLTMHMPQLTWFAMLCMWVVMVFGLVSAVDYFHKFWRKVDIRIKKRRRRELLRAERRKRAQAVSAAASASMRSVKS